MNKSTPKRSESVATIDLFTANICSEIFSQIKSRRQREGFSPLSYRDIPKCIVQIALDFDRGRDQTEFQVWRKKRTRFVEIYRTRMVKSGGRFSRSPATELAPKKPIGWCQPVIYTSCPHKHRVARCTAFRWPLSRRK